ncbi:Guanine nucleotide-binding protein G(o) subunit alpha [Clydaea vesicula]|uniref:Guanine nucleotide-binding protein G(O) subunit alpha n=1 Tax=Clydaea vesicula TaxID=447962 RepID=A0AAD5TY16_9FUNG|nr:Guanine nucleotide-binding protein G(o) subunit alpha [Clydaea vesicula]
MGRKDHNESSFGEMTTDGTGSLVEEDSINLVTALCNNKRRANQRSQQIDKQLNKEKLEQKQFKASELKLLVLGSGDSGKSTLIKQIRLLHSKGFTEKEILIFKEIILENVFDALRNLIAGAKILGTESKTAEYQNDANFISEFKYTKGKAIDNDKILIIFQRLWSDLCIKDCYMRRNEIKQIGIQEYYPTGQDIVCSRQRTTNVNACNLTVNGIRVKIFDVGGQKSLRNYWIPYFDDSKGVLFIVAISGYDQFMEEDKDTNRMIDSLQLFEKIVNNPVFRESAIILMFNKMDLFLEKLRKIKIIDTFPNFVGNQKDLKGKTIKKDIFRIKQP